MKHKVLSVQESPSSPISPPMAGWAAWRGGMAAEIGTTQIESRDNAYWPDEALLADFVEKNDRVEQADQPIEDSAAYAALYFVS